MVPRFLAALAIVVTPSFAAAQQATPLDRLSAGGFGALTVTSVTDGAAAGQVGFEVAPHVTAFGEAGRMRNVIPDGRTDAMARVVAGVYLRNPGAPVSVDGGYRATYALGGGRWSVGSFFLEGGAGAASVLTQVKKVVTNGEDITAAVTEPHPNPGPVTEPLLAIGGGVTKQLSGHVGLNVGYRYVWINTFAPSVNANVLFVGIRVGGHSY